MSDPSVLGQDFPFAAADHLGAEEVNKMKALLGHLLLAVDRKDFETARQSMDIPRRGLEKMQAWIKSKFPKVYDELQGPSKGDLNLLLDENTPYMLALALHPYGRVTSVILEGFAGRKDKYMYPHAAFRGFDAIITKDKAQIASRPDPDLTNVAIDRWMAQFRKLKPGEAPKPEPVIVHLTSQHPYRDGTVEMFKSRYDEIYDLIKSRKYAIIEVRPEGVYPRALMEDLRTQANAAFRHPSENPPPRPVMLAEAISKQVASRRGVDMHSMLELVKDEVTKRYYEAVQKKSRVAEGAALSVEDVLKILDRVLVAAKKRFGEQDDQERLGILEMAVRSVRKCVKDHPQAIHLSSGMSGVSRTQTAGYAQVDHLAASK
jgi:hypothetical protein